MRPLGAHVDLTVAIPTRNRRTRLQATLESIRRQSSDATIEVVVVDDGSTDGTADAVDALAASPAWSGRRLRAIRQPWQGAAAARNTALAAASGDIVLFVDDDVTADRGLAAAHLARHASAAAARGASRSESGNVVLGHIAVARRRAAMHREIGRWWVEHYRRLAGRPVTFAAFFTGNVSLPRSAALKAGGFDPALAYGEDVEFGYRLERAGLAFEYAPEARVVTANPKAGAALVGDMERVGRGNVRIYRKFPRTLEHLPLSGYGDTSLRLRLVVGAMLRLSRFRPAAAAIDAVVRAWAGSTAATRLDRSAFELVRRYAFWRGVRDEVADADEWARLTSEGVPILTYHSVRPAGAADVGPYAIDASRFRGQLRLLRRTGAQIVSLDAIVAAWERGELPPARAVVLTFDDGYTDNRDVALPLLRGFGAPATLFAVAGLMGRRSTWDEGIGHGPRELLHADELRGLDGRGLAIESHSLTHADLRTSDVATTRIEIEESRRILSAALGRAVEFFAYPYGHHDEAARDLVRGAGYRAAVSMDPGLNGLRTPRFALRRVAISGREHPLTFLLKVRLGADPVLLVPGAARLRRWTQGRRAGRVVAPDPVGSGRSAP